MAERKIISKYYPPDFDPSKLRRQLKTQSIASKLETVRLSSPFSMRCNKCGEFIYKGRKSNARKQITDEHYLNIPTVRLFIRCTVCSSEIVFDTDLKNEDYGIKSGATRNFEPWREARITQETEKEKLEGEERGQEILTDIEVKASNAKTEMAIADALDQIRMRNARREIRIRNNTAKDAQTSLEEKDQDEKATRKAFGDDADHVVRRLPDEEEEDAEQHAKLSAYPGSEFRRVKRRKNTYSAVLGIRRNKTT